MAKLRFAAIGWILLVFDSAQSQELARVSDLAPVAHDKKQVVSRQQIEADWLRQAELRFSPPSDGPMQPVDDAAGGNDGVKDGKDVGYYGFHTDRENEPWWHVDLGGPMPLSRAVIYNGSTPADAKRALQLKLLVSEDASRWTEVYRHDGSMFCGPSQPLTVKLGGVQARYVRVQLCNAEHLHLDEVEVYAVGSERNVALHQPSTQSSTSKWSKRETRPARTYPAKEIVDRGLKLAENLRQMGVDVESLVKELKSVSEKLDSLPRDTTTENSRALYLKAQWIVRRMGKRNNLLDFRDVLFVKRAPNRLLCHCDEYLSWWSRPGGELCVLQDFTGDRPQLIQLTAAYLPPGDILRPDLSFDGTKALFAYCRHYPDLWKKANKLDKSSIPEDAFYHLYEINLDGTGLRKLTRGKYDDFDGRYLPDGSIVFLSTRRGQFLQCGQSSAATTDRTEDLPDSFVRCGGNAYRPVSVHTLHVVNRDGSQMRAISPFESFEWNPTVAHDGRVLYARWDYVDRHRMWHMGLWSTLPDGTGARALFGNHTQGPYSIFEARSIPGSQKIIFTASAHHSHAGGSLVLLDPQLGSEGQLPMTRLTPEVPFPEWEAWPTAYYASPFPLSEDHFLVAWSADKLWRHAFQKDGAPVAGPTNSLGVYLYDAFGNLNLLYRDPDISSMYPLPVRSRVRPPVLASTVEGDELASEGRILLQDVYEGDLSELKRGSVARLRIVAVPPKTDPRMNHPVLGITQDDPGKFVLGTVPVEEDGSAYFRVPAGLPIFFQALSENGMAWQTMRSVAYVQPGQTYSCIGCHEHRQSAPPNRPALAAHREPSKITPDPAGTWPLDYQTLVQPVLDNRCTSCHQPGADGEKDNLVASTSYNTLVDYGGDRSLRKHVQARYDARRSTAGSCAAMASPLIELLDKGHFEVQLTREERHRLVVWMDTYAQTGGSHNPEQERQLHEFRRQLTPMMTSMRK